MRFFRLHVTAAVGRPDGRQLLALSELALYPPAPALARVPVSVLVNADDTPSEELEMYLHRPLAFHDFHPKSGNLNGGTEVHVYGSGFVDHPDQRTCAFKRKGGRVKDAAKSSVYVRVVGGPPPPPPPPLPPPVPLTSATSGHRVYAVPNFVTAAEASAAASTESEMSPSSFR